MASAQPLNYLSKLPQMSTATVLLVGTDNVIPMDELAKALVRKAPPQQLHVRTAKSLPLPEDKDNVRPRIDYIVFALDISKRRSYDIVQESLKFLDVQYLIGKVCLLVTDMSKNEVMELEMDRITDLADAYEMPIFKVNFYSEDDVSIFADKLLNLVHISAGLNAGVNSLLVDSTRRPYQSEHTQAL